MMRPSVMKFGILMITARPGRFPCQTIVLARESRQPPAGFSAAGAYPAAGPPVEDPLATTSQAAREPARDGDSWPSADR